ncbi:MAG: hypothetical protein KKC28_10060 [Verrucomicrobia bacterium]|nr:hypothetical protein [Verrucomicrobiota bacterium]MBU1857311.1 hypothetical protein [Verrucomicrobiota bacterium]
MIRNFFRQLKADKVRYLLISGQATVLYGAATFSEDLDIWLCPQHANLQRFVKALRTLRAQYYKLTPPLTLSYLRKRHGFHFTLPAEDGTDWYLDVMGVPPRSPAFNVAWRRSTLIRTPWGMVPVVSVPDLVELKKTQRLEDYAVISRLVLALMNRSDLKPSHRLARIFHGLRSPVKYPLWPQHDATKVSARRESALLKVNPEHERRKSFTSKPAGRTLHITREMFGLARWAVQNIFSPALLTELIQQQPWVATCQGRGMAGIRAFGSKIINGEEPGPGLEQRVEREMQACMAKYQAADRLYWRRIIAELKSLRAQGRLMPEGGKV